ncbi:MAG: ABC transporter ATP-binding protein [Acholeplasmataceae bacterium]
MLEVKNASFSYGDNLAVDNVSFTIQPGEIFGVLGANGGGKTTIFRMIMGLLEPNEGEIRYFDRIVSYEDVNEIGYLIEERSLLQKMTVENLVKFFGGLKDLDEKTVERRLDYWLNRFEITEYKKKKITELSKGNQQKIQFITAIINNPKLLVLDEPFSGLDVINTKMFVDVINDFKNNGSMIVFSSHQLDDVEAFCEKVLVLDKGKAVLNGYIKDIKTNFKKKNIKIDAEGIDLEKLVNIKGVYDVVKKANIIEVKIEDESVSKLVFDYVKTLNKVRRFDVEEAKLSDIFIETVGKKHEEV